MVRPSYSPRDSRRPEPRTMSGPRDRMAGIIRIMKVGRILSMTIGIFTSLFIAVGIYFLIDAALGYALMYTFYFAFFIPMLIAIILLFIHLILVAHCIRGLLSRRKDPARVSRTLVWASIIGILTIFGAILQLVAARSLSNLGSKEGAAGLIQWCCICRARATHIIDGKWYCHTHASQT